MSTIPTQNPVPSEAPRDLKYNSGKVDEFVTSMKNKYIDRFGQEHFTIEGLRWIAQQAISQFGYITLDSFQKGAEITLPNQVLRDEVTGEYYRWDGALPKVVPIDSTPDSSGGIGVNAWLSIGAAAFGDKISTLPTFNGVYDVFVIYGQSNAVGFAGADSGFNTSDLVNINDKALYWDGTKISALTHYMKHASGEVSTGSAWDQFANRYTSLTGRGVIFIPCAKAGVSIDKLMPGSVFYSNAMSYISNFDSIHKNVKIGKRSILFHQGEQDQLSAKDRDVYQSELQLLINNMTTDFDCETFYILMVGNPLTRSERLWQAVQNAQAFLSSTIDNCVMATRICTSFNLENKLIGSDKTHYSQKGYNLMGDDAALSVAHDLNNKTRVSNYGTEKYSSLLLPGQKTWDYLSGYITWEDNLNSFVINTSNNADKTYNVSNFTDIIYDINEKSFVLKTSTRINSLLSIDAKVNNVGELNGLSVVASRYNERNIKLDFYLDADFYINMNTGQILGLNTDTAPMWIAGNISISLDKEKSTAIITHGKSNFFPSIQPANNTELENIKTDVSFRRLNETSFIVKSTPTDYNVIMVSIRKMKINSGTARIPSFGFYVNAITSEI